MDTNHTLNIGIAYIATHKVESGVYFPALWNIKRNIDLHVELTIKSSVHLSDMKQKYLFKAALKALKQST